MKAVIAIDSFKGSLSTYEAGEAAKTGILRCFPGGEVIIAPLADGGEGSAEIIISQNGGEYREVAVFDPLCHTVCAKYGIISSLPTKTAVIEMASAAGITLISEKERDPMRTTTYGVGEMIADAIREGCRRFIVGIGGSATNDGGVGMLSALGFEFTDKKGKQVPLGAVGLDMISAISSENALPELSECEFIVACDVQNPLCGESGCSAVYGPQKGATPEIVKKMDSAMLHFAEMTKAFNKNADMDHPGCGAAGGMGFAFLSYLGGKLRSGIQLIISETGLEDKIKNADVVITGEGRLDGQSCMGKTPVGVAAVAKRYQKPVFAVSGCVTDEAKICNSYGIDAFFPILKAPCTLDDAMNKENAAKNLADTVEQIFRLLKTAGFCR